MKYECLLLGSTFITACRLPHEWSAKELEEFSVVPVELEPMNEDYEVQLAPGCVVMASRIDGALVAEAV